MVETIITESSVSAPIGVLLLFLLRKTLMTDCHISKMIWRASQSSFANVRRVVMNLQPHINNCDECKKIVNDIKAEGIKL